jgi:hypothetical protein
VNLFQQPGGYFRLYAPVKVRILLLLFELPLRGRLRDFFSASMPRKNSPKRLHLDSPLITSLSRRSVEKWL